MIKKDILGVNINFDISTAEVVNNCDALIKDHSNTPLMKLWPRIATPPVPSC